MAEWLGIESAPKNGTHVLIFVPAKAMKRRYSLNSGGETFVGRFDTHYQSWHTVPGEYRMHPTNWMPLPPLPSSVRQGESR